MRHGHPRITIAIVGRALHFWGEVSLKFLGYRSCSGWRLLGRCVPVEAIASIFSRLAAFCLKFTLGLALGST